MYSEVCLGIFTSRTSIRQIRHLHHQALGVGLALSSGSDVVQQTGKLSSLLLAFKTRQVLSVWRMVAGLEICIRIDQGLLNAHRISRFDAYASAGFTNQAGGFKFRRYKREDGLPRAKILIEFPRYEPGIGLVTVNDQQQQRRINLMRQRFAVRDEAYEICNISHTEARHHFLNVWVRLADDVEAHIFARHFAAVDDAPQRFKKCRRVLLRAVEKADVSNRPLIRPTAFDRRKLAGVEAVANDFDAPLAAGHAAQRLGPFV